MPDDKEKVETEVLNVKEQIFYQDKPIEEVIEDIAEACDTGVEDHNDLNNIDGGNPATSYFGHLGAAVGTNNYIQKVIDKTTNTLGDSQIYDNGTKVGIGTESPAYTLDVNGYIRTDRIYFGNHSAYIWAAGGTGTIGIEGYLIIHGQVTGTLFKASQFVDTTNNGGASIYFCGLTRGSDLPLGAPYILGNNAYANAVTNVNGGDVYINGGSKTPGSNGRDGNILIGYTKGNVGIGTTAPSAKLDVAGAIKVGDDSTVASASNVGAIRYRADANNSYCEMCMQTGATTYAWIIIKQNTW